MEKRKQEKKKYLVEHPECDDSIRDDSCLSCKEVFKDKERKRFQKKRKKSTKEYRTTVYL
jgi:hypothetical protein